MRRRFALQYLLWLRLSIFKISEGAQVQFLERKGQIDE